MSSAYALGAAPDSYPLEVVSRLSLHAQSMANNYGAFTAAVPPFLNIVDFAHRLVGPKPLEYISGAMNRVSNHIVPTWNPYMPRVSL